jgi:putative transposase
MQIVRGYKTELKLNNKQIRLLKKHCGAARFAYNWGLARWKELYATTGKGTSAIALHKELNALKKSEISWMYEVSKCAPQEALRDLQAAFNRFFKGTGHYPRFKSKKNGLGSFTLTGSIRVFARHIQLPRLGKLRLFERDYLPQTAKILAATVSEKAGHWFVSIQVEEEQPEPTPATGEAIGVDLGINRLASLNDRRTFANPKALKSNLKKLIRLARSLSRKQKGSKNRAKAGRLLARQHYRIGNIRRHALHKVTTAICAKNKPDNARPRVVVLEDLNVAGMLKNRLLSRAIADVGFGEFRRQISYKALWNGIIIFIANRFFPSSKKCSGCGVVKSELGLHERIFFCSECGLTLDRDLNAALNLKQLALAELKTTAS